MQLLVKSFNKKKEIIQIAPKLCAYVIKNVAFLTEMVARNYGGAGGQWCIGFVHNKLEF